MNTEQQTQTVVIISNIPAETKVMGDQDQLKEEVLKNTIQSWENAKKEAQVSAEAAKMITSQNMELLKYQAGLIPDERNITSENLDIAKERAAESLEYAKIGIAETAENAKEVFLENAEKTKVQAEVKLEEVKEKIEEKAEMVKEQIVETAGIVKEQIAETAEIAKEKIVETAGIVKEQIVETAHEVKKDAAETMEVTKRDAAINLEIAKEKVGENTEAAKEAMTDNLLYAKDVLTWAKDQLFGAAENAKEQVSENLDDLKERATETAVENLDSAKKNLEENKNERAIQNQNDEIRVKAKELHERNLEHVHVEKTTGTGIDSVEITRAQVGQKIENLKDRATETAVENLDSAKKNLVENKNESVIPNQNQEIKVKAKEMHEKNLHSLEKNDRAKEKLAKQGFIKVDSLKRRNLESANKGVGNVVRNQELSAKEMHERIIGEN